MNKPRMFRGLTRSFVQITPQRIKHAYFWHELQRKKLSLIEKLVATSGPIVQSGPFQGLKMSLECCWVDDRLAKLLGSYEAELHPALAQMLRQDYTTVVNVGCAEGYYAVGMALRSPSSHVHAFDIDVNAQRICRDVAKLNGVGTRVHVRGLCTTSALADILATGRSSCLIVDCEGAELDLLDPSETPALAKADLLVECHDFLDPRITPTLSARFQKTHCIQTISEGARDPRDSLFLSALSGFDRLLAVCEFRPTLMHWLFLTANCRN
jgi:hypothetical protein